MSQRYTIKAIVLSVLILTGSAVTSDADGSGFNVTGFLTSAAATLSQESAQRVQDLFEQSRDGLLRLIGG